jgi:hypothetical protein
VARGREGVAKRARERARQEKQEAKRQRRWNTEPADDAAEAPDEAELMEEFRVLSERHADGLVPDDEYAAERVRIFGELGIQVEAD